MSRHFIYDLMRDYLTLSWVRFSKDVHSHTVTRSQSQDFCRIFRYIMSLFVYGPFPLIASLRTCGFPHSYMLAVSLGAVSVIDGTPPPSLCRTT